MPTPLEAMIVRNGRADLLGESGTVAGASELLESLSLLHVCDFASRLNAVLHNESNTSPKIQLQLLHQLLGQKAAGAIRRLERYEVRDKAKGWTTRRVVFEELPALAAVRVSALSGAPDKHRETADARLFGEAVLHLNDVIEKHTRFPAAPSQGGDGASWTWAYYIFVNAIARYDEWEVHAMARAFDVVFRRTASLSGSPHFIDLEALLRAKLGLRPAELWTLLFVLQSHYRQFTAANVASTNALIDVKKFFEEADIRFVASEYEPLVSHLSMDVRSFREEVTANYSSEYLGYFDVARYYATPFMRFDGVIVAPSVRLLLAKLSFGLHHTIMFMVPGADRRRYLQLIGQSFEAYVSDLLRRIAKNQSSTCILEKALQDAAFPRRSNRESVADGVLFDDDNLIVWDAKSRTATAGVYAGQDLKGFVRWYTELIEEVAAQCANTVRLQQAGAFESLGLDRRPRRVVAMIVPYVPIVMHLPLGRLTSALGMAVAAKASVEFVRFTIVNPGEIEALEPLVSWRIRLQDVIVDWAANEQYNTGSLHNYCLSAGPKNYGQTRNPYLADQFKAMDKDMDAVLAARRRPKEPEARPGASA